MSEDVHDEDGEEEAEDVGRESSVEVRPGVAAEAGRKEKKVSIRSRWDWREEEERGRTGDRI